MVQKHPFTITVEGCTSQQAEQVMGERLSYDEEYRDDEGNYFDYYLGWEPVKS